MTDIDISARILLEKKKFGKFKVRLFKVKYWNSNDWYYSIEWKISWRTKIVFYTKKEAITIEDFFKPKIYSYKLGEDEVVDDLFVKSKEFLGIMIKDHEEFLIEEKKKILKVEQQEKKQLILGIKKINGKKPIETGISIVKQNPSENDRSVSMAKRKK